MLRRCVAVLIAVVALFAVLVLAVKAEIVRPNMIFMPGGTKGADTSEYQGAINAEVLADAGVVAGAANQAGHVDLDVLAEGVSVNDLLMSST